MPTESDLRGMFESADAPNALDADRIIARSRMRRLPRVVGAATIGTLAIAGFGVLGVQILSMQQQPMTASTLDQSAEDSGGAAPEGTETFVKRAAADEINLCAGPVAESFPSFAGLQLDVAFPEAAPVGGTVAGAATLTNTSAARVTGTTASRPAITLSQNGIVLWHSNGPVDSSAVVVDLEPGESLQYAASFEPVRCDVEDDLAEAFRVDLPPVPAGQYEVSAAIDFTPDPSMPQQEIPGLDLVTGPREPITLQ
ncbi:MAG: hypothetical protein JWP85_1015 [Rhodoglobus sp.]|nr:hypothetical protein [Rhodoglobus sp.]